MFTCSFAAAFRTQQNLAVRLFGPLNHKWLINQYYIQTSTHCDSHLSIFPIISIFFLLQSVILFQGHG